MNIRYRVTLTIEERQQLQGLVSGGKVPARKLKRAQILLAADAKSKATDEMIARTLGSSTSTVYRTKQRFVEEGLERALNEAPRAGASRKLSTNDEVLLAAVACSDPPAGRARWTLDLLAEEMVRFDFTRETVRRHGWSPTRRDGAEAVATEDVVHPNAQRRIRGSQEDILALYAEASDPLRPVVCFDETPRQLIGNNGFRFLRLRVGQLGSTTSTYATGQQTSSCSST